jgi:two-component system CheB/CheR fusion protein
MKREGRKAARLGGKAEARPRGKAEARPRGSAPSHVVAIGGSAGSLMPLEAVLQGLGACPAIAVLVVTHRDPSTSGMAAILQRATTLSVRDAEDGMSIQAGVVHVVPADSRLAIRGGRIALRPRARADRKPIDELFQVIADAFREHAFGVVLSGMGDDGTSGLARIKERLGICVVQAPASAEYDSMPRAAIDRSLCDIVGAPDELAARICAIVAQTPASPPARSAPRTPSGIDEVLAVVKARTGHDFRHYKKSTITRRIERRMSLQNTPTVAAYIAVIERDSAEVARLVADLLIGVTSFFRDPEVFTALRTAIANGLRQRRGAGPYRAWVAGCASGEEAYSLAMIIRECWDEVHPDARLEAQIYATDLDAAAIERARDGIYPTSIASTVGPARLARFFDADRGSYRVKRSLRDMIVFAKHNLISDPPFTRLDVLTCRNVLIYMDLELQQRLLPIFAYALAPGGILALGISETLTGVDGSFVPVDGGTHKLFERRDGARVGKHESEPLVVAHAEAPAPREVRPPKSSTLPDSVLRAIVEHVTPPVIVVDAKGELLFASQRMGRYFEPPVGRSSVNVFAMAKDGLALPLRAAIGKALARRSKVIEQGVSVRNRTHDERVDVTVWPLDDDFAGSALVAFVESAAVGKAVRASRKSARGADPLSVELNRTKAQLAALMREMSASHDLLRSANEDLQSANEELQSANEELTTSKEEMQSMNEELLSLNGELQSTNEQLVTTNDDMRNLLNSSQIPTLFLDRELRLKRFTAPAARIARLIATDIGRPVTDLSWNIRYPTLADDVAAVIETLVFKEAEVTATDGSVFTMRIHPYRTVDDLIDGVVITFIDTTAQKRLVEREATVTRTELLEHVIATWPGIAYVEDVATGRIEVVSAETERRLGYPRMLLTGPAPALWKTVRRAIAKKPGHVILRHRDGERATYRERTTVLARDPDGRPLAVLHCFRRTRKAGP